MGLGGTLDRRKDSIPSINNSSFHVILLEPAQLDSYLPFTAASVDQITVTFPTFFSKANDIPKEKHLEVFVPNMWVFLAKKKVSHGSSAAFGAQFQSFNFYTLIFTQSFNFYFMKKANGLESSQGKILESGRQLSKSVCFRGQCLARKRVCTYVCMHILTPSLSSLWHFKAPWNTMIQLCLLV